MTSAGKLLIAASLGALAACGSSGTPAPVVYGAAPPPGYAAGYGQPYAAPAGPVVSGYQPPRGPETSDIYGAAVYNPSSAPIALTPVAAEPLAPTESRAYAQNAPYSSPPAAYSAYDAPPQSFVWTSVAPGETVYAISRRTGAGPQAIIAANNLYPPYALSVGQALRIPRAAAASGYQASPPYAPANGYQPGQPLYQPPLQSVAAPQGGARVVRPGETLYSISRETRAPVQAIASANNLYPPYALQIGQSLYIPGQAGPALSHGPNSIDVADLTSTISYTNPRAQKPQSLFDWPVRGAVISAYGAGSKGGRNDGVNIAAPLGTPVRAAADGEVVYRGAELDGYGNLLLVKHRDGFVTAYAHNDVMLVRKGDKVRQGQVIAKVGQTGAVREPQLHFEIRQDLKSVDPLAFLR